jgi:hypothetical protein
MVVGVPDWDIFKGPKDITKSRKKPRLVEQGLLEGSEQSNNDQSEDNNPDDAADQVDSGAERSAAEEKARMEAEATEQALQNKMEKRSKKRNDRPPASEQDQNPAKPAKRIKTRASNPTGKSSKPNTHSIPDIAQGFNSQVPPSISQKQTKSTIDETKPISMILPNQTTVTTCVPSSSSSSSSEGTPSDYSTDTAAVIRNSTRLLNKIKIKTANETINISPEENSPINTSHLAQENIVINSDSLDHLTPHLSGDAFMHSNLNSPNHPINKFVNTTFETPISEPFFNEPQLTPVQATPVNVNASEQVKSPSPTHSDPQVQSPHHSPIHDITEQQPPSPPTEIYTP